MSFSFKSSGMLKEHSGNYNWVWMVIFKLQSDLFQTLTSDLQGLFCGCCMCPCVYRTSEHYKQKTCSVGPWSFPHVTEVRALYLYSCWSGDIGCPGWLGMGVQWPWWGEGKTTHPIWPQHPAEVESRISERLFFLWRWKKWKKWTGRSIEQRFPNWGLWVDEKLIINLNNNQFIVFSLSNFAFACIRLVMEIIWYKNISVLLRVKAKFLEGTRYFCEWMQMFCERMQSFFEWSKVFTKSSWSIAHVSWKERSELFAAGHLIITWTSQCISARVIRTGSPSHRSPKQLFFSSSGSEETVESANNKWEENNVIWNRL